MRKHIDLYVNNYSLDLGEDGKTAIKEFINIYKSIKPAYDLPTNEIFVM